MILSPKIRLPPKLPMFRWLTFLTVFSLVLGPWGFLGTVLSFSLIHLYPVEKKPEPLKIDPINSPSASLENHSRFRPGKMKMESLGDALEILSYQQIIRGSNFAIKLNLMSLLSFNPGRESVSLMRIALDDADETIRIVAGTTLQKMEDYYLTRILEQEGLNPLKRSDLELGARYRDYLLSSLVPENDRPLYLKPMTEAYDRAFLESGKKPRILKEILEAGLDLNEPILSLKALKKWETEGHNLTEIAFLRARYHYLAKEYSKISDVFWEDGSGLGLGSSKESQVMEWWCDE
jgi:hypothetical protein